MTPADIRFPDPLPVDAALPELLARLAERPNAVLVAPPGAGKTTRVPLALLAAPWRGDGRILMLEPRRLAARAAAARMAATLGEPVGASIGYRVRGDAKISARTRVEVLTEGVFTRLILDDPELTGVAAVLFDEFHERSLDGDLGLALALDAQGALRPDLRLVVMSATIDGARVAGLLGDAPVVESQGRLFAIETRHVGRDAARRVEDQVAAIVRQALAEERGSVLAFLPGQAEIRRCAEALAERLPDTVDLAPLYGALTPAEQDRAIRPAPSGRRKVVIATAIAQTSLTIEGIRVVVDCGLSRLPAYEPATGMTRLVTRRVSRASADQRRGRAGRLEPGVCYRLWDEPQTMALPAHDPPEILEADLAGFVLDLAQWGVADSAALAFLDPPPQPALEEARRLLADLDALDGDGRLTSAGRALARLPMHPRLGHMVLTAASDGLAGLAGRIAALIADPGLGGTATDLEERLRRLARDGGGRAEDARRQAARYARLAGGNERDGLDELVSAGRLLARAYPDRIAEKRGAPGAFRLANGRQGQLEPHDALARQPYLAVAEVQGAAASARILLAAALDKADIERDFAAHIVVRREVRFEADKQRVRAWTSRRLGAVVLEERVAGDATADEIAAVLLAAVRERGLDRLDWSKAARSLRARIAFAARAHALDLPDLSDETLTATLDDWLGPHLAGKRQLADITPAVLDAALDGLVDWPTRRVLDRLAPTHFAAPSGSSVPIDYAADNGPVLAIRVQELFGLSEHPSIADGKVPLLLELLSPAHRPIQVTRDLPGFWRGSWRDVKIEMKGRYPRHVWPDDPLAAAATARAKPRGT
jgi:ATP-dependent helicase HrpB